MVYEILIFTKKCYDINNNDFPVCKNGSLITIQQFETFYGEARKTRNLLAHGLERKGINYSKKELIKFALSYYCLFEYLKMIKSEEGE